MKKAPKYSNKGTGVQGSRTEYPPLTNVSSPVQAESRRRTIPRSKTTVSNDYYEEDADAVDDDSASAFEEPPRIRRLQRRNERQTTREDVEDSDQDFGLVREAGRPRPSKKRDLGPPITVDEKLESLNPIHRHVVEGFMVEAKRQSDQVSAQIHRYISSPI